MNRLVLIDRGHIQRSGYLLHGAIDRRLSVTSRLLPHPGHRLCLRGYMLLRFTQNRHAPNTHAPLAPDGDTCSKIMGDRYSSLRPCDHLVRCSRKESGGQKSALDSRTSTVEICIMQSLAPSQSLCRRRCGFAP